MPNFKYKAINQEGQTVESVLLAKDKQDVARQLSNLNMIPVSITEQESKKSTSPLKLRVKESTVILFTKQVYTMLKAGIPIVSTLNAVKEQTPDPSFKQIVETISQDIEQGSKFSAALAQFPKVFPPIYINSIKIGEVSGTLEDTLAYLYKYLEDDNRMKADVKKALRYPTFVLIGIIGAFIVFTTTVIPNFLPLFKSSGQELPIPTKILLTMYDLISNYGLLLVIVLGLIIAALVAYSRTPQGRYQLDLLLLKLPVAGNFVKKVNLARFAKLFYTMNRTGITITRAFEIMQETMGNQVYNKELKLTADKIIKGEGIAGSLKQSPYFSSLIVEMVGIGEKSGSLDDMLLSVSQYYDEDISDTVSNMTSMIEPVVTIVLGGMILLLALALFLPMWEMMNML